MKKLLFILMAFLMIAPVANADLSKKLDKAKEKAVKVRIKQFKKEKWNIVGSKTIDLAVLQHYVDMDQPDEEVIEKIGVGVSKSKNNAIQMATNNAMIAYAGDAGRSLKGRVMTDIFADGANAEGEFDHFFAAYESLVEKEIKQEMQPSFTLYKVLPDGRYEVNTYYLVSENKAAKARMRALENAMKESEIARKYAGKLSDFVKEGFNQ